MLHPFSTQKDLDADGLRNAVALRDESIQVSKIKQIRLSEVSRATVRVDDVVTPQPLAVIAKYLNAPASFLQTTDITLAQHIVDHQLKKVKADKEIVFRDGKAIGDQPAGSIRISGTEVVDKLIHGVGTVRRANFYDMGGHVDITICGDKVTMKPKVGDITEGGLRCLYSEILTRPPQLEPYVERLVCTNGMVCRHELEVFKFDDLDDFLRQFDSAIESSTKYIENSVQVQLQKAAETKVDRSEQAVRTIFANSRLNSRLLPSAIASLMEEEDGTAFGVLQAITRAANSAPYVMRLAMQESGARELSRLETAHCPTCWSTAVH